MRRRRPRSRSRYAAVQIVIELEADIEEYEAQYAAVEADEAAVQSQISDLTAQLKAQEEAARQQAANNNTSYTGVGAASTGSFIWPCPSSTYVTSKFGYRTHPIYGTYTFHNGVDISANSGASILAADGGTAPFATYSSSANYWCFTISGGILDLYAHEQHAVFVGDTVSQGDTIAMSLHGWSTARIFISRISSAARADPLNYFSATLGASAESRGNPQYGPP